VIDISGRSDLYVATLEAFASAVSGEGAVRCSGADGPQSLAIAIAALTSAELRRTVGLAEILHNPPK
jgi:predicted dehydrogenase